MCFIEGWVTMDELNSLLLVALLMAIVLTYHKVTAALNRTRLELKDVMAGKMVQIESLHAVYAELQGRPALPRTGGWAASPDFLAQLARLHHEHRPHTVVECGSGVSSLVLAALMRNQGRGQVFSLEHDAAFAATTRALLRTHELQDWCQVVDAPLKPIEIAGWSGRWYTTDGLPAGLAVDMLVVDGPPNATGPLARFPALPLLSRMLSPKLTIAVDDADRPEERAMIRRWLEMAPELRLSEHVPACEKGCAVLVR